jgi:hypothetical protein
MSDFSSESASVGTLQSDVTEVLTRSLQDGLSMLGLSMLD